MTGPLVKFICHSPLVYWLITSNEMGGGGLLPRPGAWFKRAQPSRSVCVWGGGGVKEEPELYKTPLDE